MLSRCSRLGCREGYGNVLVADAEEPSDIDEDSGHFAIWPNQDILDRTKLLASAIVDILIDVVVGRGTDRDPVAWSTREKDGLGDLGGSDRLYRCGFAWQQVPEQSAEQERGQYPEKPACTTWARPRVVSHPLRACRSGWIVSSAWLLVSAGLTAKTNSCSRTVRCLPEDWKGPRAEHRQFALSVRSACGQGPRHPGQQLFARDQECP